MVHVLLHCQVQGLLCECAPGDSLLVPAYWFVHTQLSQPACVSLQLQLTPQPRRLNSPQALQLQLSRMVEVQFGAEAGPANTRKWLQVCGVCASHWLVRHAADAQLEPAWTRQRLAGLCTLDS